MTKDRQAVLALEEGAVLQLDFTKTASIPPSLNVIPVAVQHADTKEVILVAYTSEQALRSCISTRIATFWSASRNELWIKGQSSRNVFELLEIRVNCEQNSLLYIVRPKGEAICHTRNSQGRVPKLLLSTSRSHNWRSRKPGQMSATASAGMFALPSALLHVSESTKSTLTRPTFSPWHRRTESG